MIVDTRLLGKNRNKENLISDYREQKNPLGIQNETGFESELGQADSLN